jgi:predicted nicotinamide N-methyase
MAPVDNVLATFQREVHKDMDGSDDECCPIAEQDRFAALVSDCWTDFGPSSRYIKSLIRSYAATNERENITMGSNGLMDLVFRASTIKEGVPRPEESCYLSFRLPPDDHNRPWLRIQIYPFHNDVALRLWEAGAALAEYFVENPDLLRGKNVIEIGAGVGLTGLTIAGCCGARKVHMTDYTDECRLNLSHNIAVNQGWLRGSEGSPIVTQGYFDWSCMEISGHQAHVESLTNVFDGTDVLVAADVIYDVANLKHLVSAVHCFLEKAPDTRHAIFGITKRNMKTFDTFIELLLARGIVCDFRTTGEDHHHLPLLFPCKFNQVRTDVRIAFLSMSWVPSGC